MKNFNLQKRFFVKIVTVFYVFICLCTTTIASAQETHIARTIITLYDSKEVKKPSLSWIHQLAEMPLNHLGLKLEYHDIQQPLPDIKNRDDIRGVLSWYTSSTLLKKPKEYLNWAIDAADNGIKFVIMGNPGLYEDHQGEETPIRLINKFYEKLGFKDSGAWTNLTYDVNFTQKDENLVNFERQIAGILEPYPGIIPIRKDVKSYLVSKKRNIESHLILTSNNGGYISQGYAHYYNQAFQKDIRQWYINPFIFFKNAFATNEIPKPDTTTIAGRRIYYSHIDGDGWNNVTMVEKYNKSKNLSSDVIYQEVLQKYTDLPVTVGIIGADIDKKWVGTDKARESAKKILALPHIEIGSHTYSHPLNWSFFETGDLEAKERPFLRFC